MKNNFILLHLVQNNKAFYVDAKRILLAASDNTQTALILEDAKTIYVTENSNRIEDKLKEYKMHTILVHGITANNSIVFNVDHIVKFEEKIYTAKKAGATITLDSTKVLPIDCNETISQIMTKIDDAE